MKADDVASPLPSSAVVYGDPTWVPPEPVPWVHQPPEYNVKVTMPVAVVSSLPVTLAVSVIESFVLIGAVPIGEPLAFTVVLVQLTGAGQTQNGSHGPVRGGVVSVAAVGGDEVVAAGAEWSEVAGEGVARH